MIIISNIYNFRTLHTINLYRCIKKVDPFKFKLAITYCII